MKTATVNNQSARVSKPIGIYTDTSTISININKKWCARLLKNSLIATLLAGFLTCLWLSYSMEGQVFWSLVKIGFIVGLMAVTSVIINKKS